jgi:hypothetical protein
MTHQKLLGIFLFCWVLAAMDLEAATKKPDFSGIWQLDVSRSELKYGAPDSERTSHPETSKSLGSGHSGGSGMSGSGMENGGRNGNYPGAGHSSGGHGSGSMGGGHGTGGSAIGGGSAAASLRSIPVIDSYGIGSVADQLKIVQKETSIKIEKEFQPGHGEQIRKFDFTTDGKDIHKSSGDGNSYHAKTQWSGSELVTKSEVTTPVGSLEVIEKRRLSEDQRFLIIQIKTKDHASNWSGTAVYTKIETDNKAEK